MLTVAPVCTERPFCMPPPRNCSPSRMARCWVAVVAPNVIGDVSAKITEPSGRRAPTAPVARSTSTATASLAIRMVSPSVTATSAPSKLSRPTTMSAVRAGSSCGVFAGSLNSPLGSASRRNVPSSRNVTRRAPCSAVNVTRAPSWSTSVMAPSEPPAGSTGTSGFTCLTGIGVVAAVVVALEATLEDAGAAPSGSEAANAGATPAPVAASSAARPIPPTLATRLGRGVRWWIIISHFPR